MPSTTPYRRGDVVLVPFPFTDLTSSKKRPAVVISPDSFNAQQQDLVVVAITSQLTDSDDAVLLTAPDFSAGSLPKTSIVRPTKLFTMHSTLIIKKVAVLNDLKLDEILSAVRRFFS